MTAVVVAGAPSDEMPATRLRSRQRVVVCGPEHAFSEIQRVRSALEALGVRAVASEPTPMWVQEADHEKLTRVLQHRDMLRLHDRRTRALIIVNQDISGHFDSVDPWSLCQASVAFYRGLAVYLWRGLPSLFEEQLLLWGAQTLGEDIQRLPLDDLAADGDDDPARYGEQLTLFDVTGGPRDERHPSSPDPLLRHSLPEGRWG